MITQNKAKFCCINDQEAEKLKEKFRMDQSFIYLADFFKLFSDPSRLRILQLLGERELCVNDLCQLLEMEQTAVSHQLMLLRKSRLVKYRRQGRMMMYSLDDDHISRILAVGQEHLEEAK